MIEFEHSLFKLLLLVAVLSAKPPGRKWLPFVIGGAFLLALLPPPVDIPVPWELLLGLAVPLLLWQNARRIIRAKWQNNWKDLVLWVASALLFATVFWVFKELEIASALLFGLIAASLIWSVGEDETNATMVSLIGPFTLIILLAEVDPFISTPSQYLGGVFSGLFFGALIAFLAVLLACKTAPQYRDWIAIGQIFLSYWVAVGTGVSAVAASLASTITFGTLGLYYKFWRYQRVTPTPLNTWPGFSIILATFLLLGWQGHYPPSRFVLVEVLVGFVVGFGIAWIGQRLDLAAFPHRLTLWRVGLRVSLLIFPALLIWPHQTMEQPQLLGYAIGIALINIVVARFTIDFFFARQ